MSTRQICSLKSCALAVVAAMASANSICCPDPPREIILSVDSVSPDGGSPSSPVTIRFFGTDRRSISTDSGNSLFYCRLLRKIGTEWETEAYFWVPDQQDPNKCTWTAFVPYPNDADYKIRDITYIFPNVSLQSGSNEFLLDVSKQDVTGIDSCQADTAYAEYDVTYTH